MRPSSLHLMPLLLLAAACGQPEGEASGADSTTTHALLKVEHTLLVGAEGATSARAFAGVVRLPELADPAPLLRLYGGDVSLPGIGQCVPVTRERDGAVAPELIHAEFLDAGDVSLRASNVETALAPRAFPSSITELPGVVYTSRDSSSEALPAGALYSLRTSGSDQLAALEMKVQAPELLTELLVGGVPLTELASVSTQADIGLNWRAGDARDIVYVEVAGSGDQGSLGVCAFRDSDGRGSLPRGLFGVGATGSLSFHRLREVAAEARALDAAEVRFDFELTTEVSFQ